MPGTGYPATARVVNLSPKPQKPEVVMVRGSNRNSSTAELMGLSRNHSRSTAGKSERRKSQWDKEACGCKKKGAEGQWDREACGCRDRRMSTSTLAAGAGQWDKEGCGCGGKKGVGQWDKEACGCQGGSKRSTATEVTEVTEVTGVAPPPMAAKALYEALGGGSGLGPPVSPHPATSRPVTWMKPAPGQPSPMSTARNSADSLSFMPSPIVGTPIQGGKRRSYIA